jgi:hypothetical protein
MQERPPVIVIPVSHPRAVAVMRSLARSGVRVIAVDDRRHPAAFFSNTASAKFRIPRGPEADHPE